MLPPTCLISTSNNKVTMLNTLVWGPQCVIKSKLSHYLEITHRTTDSISCISIVCYQSVLKTKKAILHTVDNDNANYPSGFDHDDTRRGHMIEPKWCISGPISQTYTDMSVISVYMSMISIYQYDISVDTSNNTWNIFWGILQCTKRCLGYTENISWYVNIRFFYSP